MFSDASALDDHDLVDLPEGRETVGDDHQGAAVASWSMGAHDLALRLDVEAGGGFVENEDRSIPDDGASDGARRWRWPLEKFLPRFRTCVS